MGDVHPRLRRLSPVARPRAPRRAGHGCRIRGLSEASGAEGARRLPARRHRSSPDCPLLAIVLGATYLNRGCRSQPDRSSTARQPTPRHRGSLMIKFYYHPSPNPAKVALFLEESGLPYELVAVDTRKGEQHAAAFTALNPNAKTPALVDGDATVFDSNAILLYLAEKTGKFLPANTPAQRAQMYSWLMFVPTGIGPYSGPPGT